ncbi:hypothetical protein P106B_89 [Rhizobium phage vB_RglS_P106B]|uniref:Transmembrane protein n=1 Tax=Rhizobium phage vB_RglS_P106B TaxID=1458697 RepID=W6EC54_9CAUD|nr:hypothetical protein P106B_89 [Rhizobium phage vB_RglS_P106B]AHJ10772.1 hypothetical protein P106B_89 [Rhizobium phage vB_RglS_P106B]
MEMQDQSARVLIMMIWILTLFTLAMLAIEMSKRNSDDMAICQLSHSHDVCFQTLNR